MVLVCNSLEEKKVFKKCKALQFDFSNLLAHTSKEDKELGSIFHTTPFLLLPCGSYPGLLSELGAIYYVDLLSGPALPLYSCLGDMTADGCHLAKVTSLGLLFSGVSPTLQRQPWNQAIACYAQGTSPKGYGISPQTLSFACLVNQLLHVS